MNDNILKIRPVSVLNISQQDVQTLLSAGDGDAALLYLYTIQHHHVLDPNQAAIDLNRSDRDIRTAVSRLQQLGLFPQDSAPEKSPEPARELPEYQASDLTRCAAENPDFQALVNEAQETLGRVLSTYDLKSLLYIYDALSLPAEVIMLLLHYCKENHDRQYGAQKRLGFSAIISEARSWFDLEIMTAEQAEQLVAKKQRRGSQLHEAEKALGIRGRGLSPSEKRFLNEWLDLGFGTDAIALAADRTITNTGGLKWKYMNSIVQSWHSRGLHTVAEIEAGDERPDARAHSGGADKFTAAAQPTQDDARSLEQLDRLLEKMKSGS